jgi:transcription elongation factor GreA
MQHAISKDGFLKLKDEWEQLKYVERPAMQKQVGDAAAEGDRSENAAYTYGKMRLRQIDQRLRALDKLLDGAKVVDMKAPVDGSIRFGAIITLEDIVFHKKKTYHLVGTEEIDPLAGRISMDSPMGKALLGKKISDEIQVQVPRGIVRYTILEIKYQ